MDFITAQTIEDKEKFKKYDYYFYDENGLIIVEVYVNGQMKQRRPPINLQETIKKYGKHFPELERIFKDKL